MKLRLLLKTLGATPNDEQLLKRAMQIFNFFREYGYSADDIHMAHDSNRRMGMALKLNGRVVASVACGCYEGTREDWEHVWSGWAEHLPLLDQHEVYDWVFADGTLDTVKLGTALAKEGVFPVGIVPASLTN